MESNDYKGDERMKELLIDLQLFADGEGEGDTNDTNIIDDEAKEKEPEVKEVPKYTDKDLDKIIARKIAEANKKAEKEASKKAEAERLKNMTAQEKKDHELEELKKELAQMKRESALSAMGKEARSILSERNIHVSDSLITNLISDDADKTKEAVESFAEEFQKAVESAVAEKLKGNAPKTTGTNKSVTKDEIMKIKNAKERQEMIRKHMDLFK